MISTMQVVSSVVIIASLSGGAFYADDRYAKVDSINDTYEKHKLLTEIAMNDVKEQLLDYRIEYLDAELTKLDDEQLDTPLIPRKARRYINMQHQLERLQLRKEESTIIDDD